MLCSMIFFRGNLMNFDFLFVEILFNLWILAFSDGNSKFESGSPAK